MKADPSDPPVMPSLRCAMIFLHLFVVIFKNQKSLHLLGDFGLISFPKREVHYTSMKKTARQVLLELLEVLKSLIVHLSTSMKIYVALHFILLME